MFSHFTPSFLYYAIQVVLAIIINWQFFHSKFQDILEQTTLICTSCIFHTPSHLWSDFIYTSLPHPFSFCFFYPVSGLYTCITATCFIKSPQNTASIFFIHNLIFSLSCMWRKLVMINDWSPHGAEWQAAALTNAQAVAQSICEFALESVYLQREHIYVSISISLQSMLDYQQRDGCVATSK